MALKFVNKVASKHSSGDRNVASLLAEANQARDEHRWKEAAERYAEYLELCPDEAPIWVQYGHALKECGNLDEAEKAYRKSLEMEPGAADTHLQLGHLYKMGEKAREAEQAYIQAFKLAPSDRHAKAELVTYGWSASRLRLLIGAEFELRKAVLALELSDLVDFLQNNRYPTGIQRVQLALAHAFADIFNEEIDFVYFDYIKCAWRIIERSQLLGIIDLVNNSAQSDDARNLAAAGIKNDLLTGEDYRFTPGCALVNPGTSWGYLNYFLAIREAKKRSAIKYVPLVHDCIPLIFQEFCNPVLVNDFVNWVSGILSHADLILTNSENTKADFYKAAQELEVTPKPCKTVHLNGEFSAAQLNCADHDRATVDALRDNNLDVEDFVLLVSTIEPRKNHALALAAWSKMLKSLGRNIPRLVCVGNSGWMNDDFHQRLARDKVLRGRVVVLNNVSDNVLKLLYKNCLFTLFPSLYEGWGLPISESLAHGKVPLVSNIASHPEAGGDLAVYFDVNSETDFQSRLQQLIFDAEYRRSLERKIASGSPLRPWKEIAQQVFDIVESMKAGAPKSDLETEKALTSPPSLICGVYYSFARNTANRLRDILHSGDAFREASSWHSPEHFGCWIDGKSADLAFSLNAATSKDFIIYIHWTGSPNIDNETVISLPGSSWSKEVKIGRGQDRWEAIPISFGPSSSRQVRIRISSVNIDDFSQVTDGTDNRLSSVGVKGLYVAAASDTAQRLAISESILLGDFEHLARRFPNGAKL